MAEPENHTIHVLREIRAAIQRLDGKVEGLDKKVEGLNKKVDANHQEVKDRFKILQQALNGESVLGRYAAAEVEERLTKIEKRLSTLEKAR